MYRDLLCLNRSFFVNMGVLQPGTQLGYHLGHAMQSISEHRHMKQFDTHFAFRYIPSLYCITKKLWTVFYRHVICITCAPRDSMGPSTASSDRISNYWRANIGPTTRFVFHHVEYCKSPLAVRPVIPMCVPQLVKVVEYGKDGTWVAPLLSQNHPESPGFREYSFDPLVIKHGNRKSLIYG